MKKLDMAITAVITILFIPLSIWGGMESWAGPTDMLPFIMMAIAFVYVIIEGVRLKKGLIAGLLGALIGSSIFLPSLIFYFDEVGISVVMVLVYAGLGAVTALIANANKRNKQPTHSIESIDEESKSTDSEVSAGKQIGSGESEKETLELAKNKSAESFERFSGSGVCDVCNKEIGPRDGFLVPNEIFYASKKYRERMVQSGMLFGASVEEFIAVTKAMDPTSDSAVCQDCIHLFKESVKKESKGADVTKVGVSMDKNCFLCNAKISAEAKQYPEQLRKRAFEDGLQKQGMFFLFTNPYACSSCSTLLDKKYKAMVKKLRPFDVAVTCIEGDQGMSKGCAHCDSNFYKPKSMVDKVDGFAMQKVRVGCSKCETAVCFSCAASEADKRGKEGNCFCPKCGTELGREGEAGGLGEHFIGWN